MGGLGFRLFRVYGGVLQEGFQGYLGTLRQGYVDKRRGKRSYLGLRHVGIRRFGVSGC